MKRRNLVEIPSFLLKWFLALYLLHPAFFAASFIITIQFEDAFRVVRVIGVLAAIIVASFTALFLFHNRKLGRLAESLSSGGRGETVHENPQAFIARYPLFSSAILHAGCAGGPVLTVILGLHFNVLISWQQALFFLLTGEFTATIAAAVYFYVAKTQLYAFNNYFEFSPLSLFHKFAIPILAAVMTAMTVLGFAIYNLSYKNTMEMQTRILGMRAGEASQYIDSYMSNIVTELRSNAQTNIAKTMDLNAIGPWLVGLHKMKGSNIEMIFTAAPSGEAETSIGVRRNIKDRDYFKEVMSRGKTSFSTPVLNKATGKEIVVCALPVLRGGRTIGVIGATILISSINDMLSKSKGTDGATFLITTPEGKVVYFLDKGYVDKILGKEITDDGASFINVNRVLSEPDGSFFDMAFAGKNVYAVKTNIPTTGQNLIMMVDKSSHLGKTNMLMIQIIISLILISIIIFAVILAITKTISSPILNTITIFKRATAGDLTASTDDYVPDEFGELIKNLKLLLKSLREIARATIESSKQLVFSSESLASTSQDLAQGAQNQAASVEQASASLEEVSASIENIAESARTQSDLAAKTNKSMEDLQTIITRVAEYAGEAQQMAGNSTREAVRGNELMQNAIRGMNNIDDSTKKISEMVTLISDISDQVNLLALNAAIEAARAGEHGRGFAVVADEIGKLAEQTAMSAKDITSHVNTGLHEVLKGREYVDATSKALANIIENIRKTDELVRKISQSAQSQADASRVVLEDTLKVKEMAENISYATTEQMNTNREMVNTVNQINQLTQSVAAGAEEIASSSEEISAQALGLKDQIAVFKIE